MPESNVASYPYCFGCGQENPVGLRLDLRMEDGTLRTEFVPQMEHQGWPGIVHGGVIASLLYEVLENFAYYQGVTTMMHSMETRYRHPAEVGSKIRAQSWLVESSRRKMSVAATLTDEKPQIIAEGNADLVLLTRTQKARLGLS